MALKEIHFGKFLSSFCENRIISSSTYLPQKLTVKYTLSLHICSVYLDIIEVLFIHQLMH